MKITQRTYEEYTNRETWLVSLYIIDKQEYYVQQVLNLSKRNLPLYYVSDFLCINIHQNIPIDSGLYFELIRQTLFKVDWLQLAAYLIESVNEEEEISN